VAAGLGSTWWQYLLLFLAVAASWAGVPFIGTAALGAAGVGASQGHLDPAAVLVVAVIAGERLYARWGWLAVFVTPAIVSGTAKMRPAQFAVWNFVDSALWSVSVAASAYGVARLATGHHTAHDITILVIGLVAGTLVTIVAIRRHRRRAAQPAHASANGAVR